MAYASVGHVGPFVTRKMARALGMTRFFSGIPCKIGHFTERWSSTNVCIECYVVSRPRRHLTVEELAYRVEWRRNNAELARSHRRAAYIRRKTKENADAKAWKTKNQEKVRSYDRNRKATKAGAGGTHTGNDVSDIYRLQKGKCAYCKVGLFDKYHVDHIVPLAKGGTNGRRNLQLTCEPCNLHKSDVDPLVFAGRLGRLV